MPIKARIAVRRSLASSTWTLGLLTVQLVVLCRAGLGFATRNVAALHLQRAVLSGRLGETGPFLAIAGRAALRSQDAGVRASWTGWAEHTRRAGLVASETGQAEGRLLLSRGYSTMTNDTELAVHHFTRATEVGTEQTRFEAHLWLAVLAAKEGRPYPLPRLHSQADVKETIALPNVPSDHGYVLDSLLVDEHDLRLGVPVHILAVWRDVNDDRASLDRARVETWEGGEWLVADSAGYRYILGEGANMLRDGAFSRVVSPRIGPPVGFRTLYRRQTADDCGLDYGGDAQGLALRMCGRESTGVGVGSIPVNALSAPGLFVLQGRFRTDGDSQPRVGVRWAMPSPTDAWAGKTRYVVQQASNEWSRFVALLEPPVGTDQVGVWAIELSPEGCLYVDDLGLFHIPRPSVFGREEGAVVGEAADG